MTKHTLSTIFFLILTLLISGEIVAEKVLYVTDKIEITLRTGPSIENKILRMLPSGTKLYPQGEVMDGWIKVKTESGLKGWVLEKYTIFEPPAFFKLKKCMAKIQKLSKVMDENKELKKKLTELEKQYQILKVKYMTLKNDAANIDTIKNNFLSAQKELQVLKSTVLKLEKENAELKSKKNLHWFMLGALTVVFSFLIGFVFGKIQKRRNRSLYF